MLGQYATLHVADNTGALIVRVIQAASGRKMFVGIGDVLTGTVKKSRPDGQIKKGQVVKAVVVRQRKPLSRPDGTTVRFSDNACVIIGGDKNPIGTRVMGPIAKEVKDAGYIKIAQLAKEVI